MFSSKTNFSMLSICFWDNILYNKQVKMKIMEFQKKYLLWRMDFSEPLRIPDFRVLEIVETGETYAIISYLYYFIDEFL